MVQFEKFLELFITPKKIICLSILIIFLLLGCVPQHKIPEPEPPVSEIKRSCSWEDKIWFKNDKNFYFDRDLQIKECKIIPIIFESSGKFEVINKADSQVSLYLNQQRNNEPGSTKYINKVEKQIDETMTDSDWYLHVVSEFDKSMTISLELKFLTERKASSQPVDKCIQGQSRLNQAKAALLYGRMNELKKALELCHTIKIDCPGLKTETETLEKKLSDKISEINQKNILAQVEASVESNDCSKAMGLLKNIDISTEIYGKAEKLVNSCGEIPPIPPAPPDPCIQSKNILSQCKKAFEDEEYEQVYNLCMQIDTACPDVRKEGNDLAKSAKIMQDQRKYYDKIVSLTENENCRDAREYSPKLNADSVVQSQAEQLIETCEKELFDRIISLTDNEKCKEARELLPNIEANSNFYSQAEQLIETCENPCRFLGTLTIKTQGSVRKGEGVSGTGELERNQEECYQVKILKRGDLSVWVDMGYKIRGGQLEFNRVVDVINTRGEKENKMRYRWLNIAPDTNVEVWLQNPNGGQGYVIEFYLYPN